jgi:hypothetical protein
MLFGTLDPFAKFSMALGTIVPQISPAGFLGFVVITSKFIESERSIRIGVSKKNIK